MDSYKKLFSSFDWDKVESLRISTQPLRTNRAGPIIRPISIKLRASKATPTLRNGLLRNKPILEIQCWKNRASVVKLRELFELEEINENGLSDEYQTTD